MFYAHEVNEWAWPRVHVNVTTFPQFAQTASLLALNIYALQLCIWADFQTIFFLLSEAINVALLYYQLSSYTLSRKKTKK